MHVPRPLPVFLSFLFAVGLWFFGALRLQTDGPRHGGGYATLVCGDAYSDREIRDRLDSQGLKGLVSESDQWALLDCFGNIEKVPLAEYDERLLPFDPRNDGYAEKLKSVFVRDGKRFVYIPLGINSPENMDAAAARALTGIPYSLVYAKPPTRRDILFPLLSFCLTACAFFVIPPLRRRLNSGLSPCLIALSPLALGAAPGFALAALLAGFAALLTEPSGQEPPYAWQKAPLAHAPLARDLPGPFTPRWLLALALIACYCFFSFLSGLPVLFALFVLAAFCCALALSLKAGGAKIPKKLSVNRLYPRTQSGRRFNPVEIISRRNTEEHSFFPVMLPFALMAIALAFAGFAMPQPPSQPSANTSPLQATQLAAPPLAAPLLAAPPPADAVTEADFQEHFLFQSSFSYRALGKTYEAGELPLVAGYELSSNDLIEPAAPASPAIGEELKIPDFPLGDLLRGISRDLEPPRAEAVENRGNSADWLFVSLPVIFILPALVYNSRKRKQRKGPGIRDWGVGRSE